MGGEVLEQNEPQSSMGPAARGGSKTALPPWADSGIASHQEPKVAFPVEVELSALALASGSPGEKQIYSPSAQTLLLER